MGGMKGPKLACPAVWLGLILLCPSAAAQEPGAGRAVHVGNEVLLNYDPEPALVTKQTPVDRARFAAIDIHCHWNLQHDPHRMIEAMDQLNVRAAANLSGGFGADLERMLGRFHSVSRERFIIFCNLDFSQIDEPDFPQRMVRLLEAAHEHGARGLKIFKNLGLTVQDAAGNIIPVDDPRLDPVWARAGELGMPVLIHSADPIAFFEPVDEKNERWMQLRRHPSWSFHGPEFPDRDDVLAQRNRVIARHPQTMFIGAHIAESGEDLALAARWLDELPNLYVDISGRVSELGRQPYSARRFLITYQDRVLFGTDRFPGRPDQPRYRPYFRFLETDDEYFNYHDHHFPPSGDWRIHGVFLPDEVLKKIYHDNAARLLGMEQ
jgi:uncharacterized protein